MSSSSITGVDAVRRQLQDAAKQVRFAAMLAATATAKAAQAEVKAAIPMKFDRPTRYTQNSTFVKPATKDEPAAVVGLKNEAVTGTPATKYLLPQVEGGARRPKRFERALQHAGLLPSGRFATPGDSASLDAAGNMSRGQVTKVLSALRASPDATQNRGKTRGRGSRRRESYFVGTAEHNLSPGVYKRVQGGRREIVPVLHFVKAPQYQPRLPFYEIVGESIRANYQAAFANALQRALATRR